MPLIYITGPAGSGKSMIRDELRRRQYEAHDEDDPGIGAAFNKRTGEMVKIPSIENRTPKWFLDHEWRMFPATISNLRRRSGHKPVFLCGNTATEEELKVFDKIIFLDVDEQTLRTRIASRENNDFGQSEYEIQMILDKNKKLKKTLKNKAVFIKANQSLDSLVFEIIEILSR